MYKPGETAEISVSDEALKCVLAGAQLKSGQKVKILSLYEDGWIRVEGECCEMPCPADIPIDFLKEL